MAYKEEEEKSMTHTHIEIKTGTTETAVNYRNFLFAKQRMETKKLVNSSLLKEE